jgi:hypothetical protein
MDGLWQYYGTAEGPLGFPMTDQAAKEVDALLKRRPHGKEFEYRKAVVEKGPTDLLPGERADISWISTEDPDRSGEVVLARGMDDGQYKQNPLVTMQHAYWLPPVGKSIWRKQVKENDGRGIKAKTQYPQRPSSWPEESWPPDVAFSLVQSDLLRGKSIGFLPTKVHVPDQKELDRNGWTKVGLVIDEWVLLEYACCYLPCQQNAVVEAVSKALIPPSYAKALGVEPKAALPAVVPFTPLEEVEKALERMLQGVDLSKMAAEAAKARISRFQGRV